MEQKQQKLSTEYIYSIGFFGGVFGSMLAFIAHFFNFIPYGPGVIFQMLAVYPETPWLRHYPGHLFAVGVLSLVSILVALLYYALFRKIESVLMGIGFGMFLWAALFLGLNTLIPGVQSVAELGWGTNIIFVCIFVLYGLFTGYSLSYGFYRQQQKSGA